jgi:RNA-binding protein
MMDEKFRQLRSEGTMLKPRFIIGKNGLNDEVIKNIIEGLKNEHIIKIKILPSYIGEKDKKSLVADIVQKTNSQLVQFIGFTIVLTRKS